MRRREVEELVMGEAERVAGPRGMEVVDVEYQTGPQGRLLRVFIDKPGGVTVEDCRQVSEALSGALDLSDPIPGPYRFEVSSPGIERPLRNSRDFERFAGRPVEIHTFDAIGGRRHFTGTLLGVEGDAVRIQLEEGTEVAISRQQISKARLRARWQGAVEI